MKLRVGKRAQQQIVRMDRWWVEYRPSAPTLFLDELRAAFERICEVPDAGARWPTARRPSLRRILVGSTKNHVYFLVDEAADTVYVLAVWGAPRGTTPKL